MIIKESFFQRNLLALGEYNGELCTKILHVEEQDNILFEQSRNGQLIPCIIKDGKKIYLHSRMDPVSEARRLSLHIPSTGYLILFGFGAGYHILPLLENEAINRIIIIENDIALFKAVCKKFDLKEIFLDMRVKLLINATPDEIADFVCNDYLPGCFGNLSTFSLRSATTIYADYYKGVFNQLQHIIETISGDYTVQTHFGKRWFTNTLRNLQYTTRSFTQLKPSPEIITVGAGPSLEFQIDFIKNNRRGKTIISTDTALPCLFDMDILPDIVISIDCQHISYHHFLKKIPDTIPVVVDLATPPTIVRSLKNTFFVSSQHPFSNYCNQYFRKFPILDMSGGNVSHAAISLASKLGARRIYLCGMDFSYPFGKIYARNTYLYSFFNSRSNRIESLESSSFGFLLRNNDITKERVDDFLRYTTKPMINYKEKMEDFIKTSSVSFIQLPGMGIPLNIPVRNIDKKENPLLELLSPGPQFCDLNDFLRNYLNDIEKLPAPTDPFIRYLYSLTKKQKEITTTLLPLIAHLRKNENGDVSPTAIFLSTAYHWAGNAVESIL